MKGCLGVIIGNRRVFPGQVRERRDLEKLQKGR